MTCSLIIIAYNEERNIAFCLDAVARQSVMPDEVLVIDNNSTDKTAKIASSYPFVRVIEEKEQGMIPARNRGFNEAKGDILMRIDADVILSERWVEHVIAIFGRKDIDGVSGAGTLRWPDVGRANTAATFMGRVYFWGYGAIFGGPILWGANMAIKKDAWLSVRGLVCNDSDEVHEDQDLSLWLDKAHKKLVFSSNMMVAYDAFNITYLPRYISYVKKQMRTSRWHWRHEGYSAPLYTLPKRLFVFVVLLPFLLFYLATITLLSIYIFVLKRGKNPLFS